MIDVKHVVPVTLLVQLCVSFVVAAALWVWIGEVAGVSALLGGAAVVIPNGFLAARVLQPSRDESARAMMRSAWIGAIGKLLLTALLFGVIFGVVRPIEPPAVPAPCVGSRGQREPLRESPTVGRGRNTSSRHPDACPGSGGTWAATPPVRPCGTR